MTGDGPKMVHFGPKMAKHGRLVNAPKYIICITCTLCIHLLSLKNEIISELSLEFKESGHHDWRSAVLSSVEWLPDQHGGLLQAPQGREELLWCDDRYRGDVPAQFLSWSCVVETRWKIITLSAELHPGSTHESSQDDLVRLLTLFQEPVGAEPRQAPHHHTQGAAGCL